ncbi:probable G-protein coupled receptor 141 [Myxocyprinus asiaticus]|uniref:probable G-protein coupled receptor 141 n=1 Tax=Myxocyprinus asiaticus TaxID=70543 RepID=UPI00222130DB|nr:probable G-protein coupled receptor 141 [Myxocyprinus asiaticus]
MKLLDESFLHLSGHEDFTKKIKKRVKNMVSEILGNNTTSLLEDYRIALRFLYIFIFVGGTLNVVLMSCLLQSQRRLSFTKVSVINLIAVHAVFLFTVPFRIYYYYEESSSWRLGMYMCKIVSVMIHAHMYLAFIFYVFLLIVRYVEHSRKQQKLEFHRLLHATIASATVWIVILGILLPPTLINYGSMQNDTTQCFHFGDALKIPAVKTLNYVICILVMLIWSVLVFFQIYFLLFVSKKFGKGKFQYQEFRAQLKNVVFLLVVFLCFLPYQAFRIYYVSLIVTGNYDEDFRLKYGNEIFLAVTAFSCLDMIFFSVGDIRRRINSRGCMCCS